MELPESLAFFLDREAAAQGLDYVELRGHVPWDSAIGEAFFTRRLPYVTFILDLSRGYAAVRQDYAGNLIKNLHKADKCVDIVEQGTPAMPDELYRLYLAQMRKFGSPPLPIGYFSGLLACALARLYVAKVQGRTAAFLMVLVSGQRMSAEINASFAEFDPYFPKVRLFDHALRRACQEGLEEFDFMRTRKDSGVYWHKKKWGGVEHPIPYYLRACGGRVPEIADPEQGRYLLPRLCFKCMPLSLSAYVGPRIRSWIGK